VDRATVVLEVVDGAVVGGELRVMVEIEVKGFGRSRADISEVAGMSRASGPTEGISDSVVHKDGFDLLWVLVRIGEDHKVPPTHGRGGKGGSESML